MADGQEEMSVKAKLSKLHCPFTWEILDSMIKHSMTNGKSGEVIDPTDQIINDETTHCLERLLRTLFQCYKAVSSADNAEATTRIEKAEEILMEVQQEKEFHRIIRAIEHVFYATKCFFLYETDNIDGVEEISPNIVDVEDFTDVELGALYGCQSVVWSCLKDHGMDKAVAIARKAVEKNQDCALWHFNLAMNLRRQRRLINVSSDVSDIERKHFEIAYAISKNHIFGIYFLQMRMESFYKFNKERSYMEKKVANEREVIKIAKDILKSKPSNFKVLVKLALMFLRAHSDERQSAKECLDAVNKIAPNNSTYLHYSAMLYEQSGDYREALKYFKKAAECNNFVAELCYIQYGWEVGELEPLPHLLRMLKKYEQSVKERKIAILLAIAIAYYSLRNDLPNAAEYFLKALAVDPLNKKFKTYYKCFDFTTGNITSFLNVTFCPLFEKRYLKTHRETYEEIIKLLNMKEMSDLMNDLCTLSVNVKENQIDI
ncbi:PREDICTED: uncharacterized protein LOC105561293 [Vollenhovia emeryi]|uniref:uncharacterized protein LOC105561293 n=1 Tax=Vollenhovia emeryi TaxID=411798 RepID=UPI0005F49237|nr:PREDICTED: uncharacterized protein LOC105561293 [Vollenhovia emeryi]XP_011866532.1 PREDICTED: uncharacterized protein LOC105561293 [Vollenhovia emeryi]XP_011866533.1 PREDICTED: uncharacterized protein LOC105561293 [Vollenhovia emeryi]